jgi:hypothetical protein
VRLRQVVPPGDAGATTAALARVVPSPRTQGAGVALLALRGDLMASRQAVVRALLAVGRDLDARGYWARAMTSLDRLTAQLLAERC